MTTALLPRLKKSTQRAGVWLIGAQLDRVNPRRAKQFEEFGLRFGLPLRESRAFALIARVDLDHFAGFGVFQNQAAQRGEFKFETVRDLHGHHIMAIPVSNASVNPARSLGSAVFGGTLALSQLWLFWVAPILGAVIGGTIARWLQEEGTS